MGIAQPVKRFTVDEYYSLEHAAAFKSDFYDGEIFAMAGGSARHSLICTNIGGELRQRLKNTLSIAYESNLRLKVKATGLRTYPDVSVYCGSMARDFDDSSGETYTNPTVVFEVLSKTTEAYDRGFKSQNYRQIESLRTHVLVSQHVPLVEVFDRQSDGLWVLRETQGIEKSLRIDSLNIAIPMAEIYARVDFTVSDSSPVPER